MNRYKELVDSKASLMTFLLEVACEVYEIEDVNVGAIIPGNITNNVIHSQEFLLELQGLKQKEIDERTEAYNLEILSYRENLSSEQESHRVAAISRMEALLESWEPEGDDSNELNHVKLEAEYRLFALKPIAEIDLFKSLTPKEWHSMMIKQASDSYQDCIKTYQNAQKYADDVNAIFKGIEGV